MKNVSRKTLHFPHFLYLLPLFFVFHGYAKNPGTVTFSDFIALAGEYLLASGGLLLLGWTVYRDWQKAMLFSFGLLFLHLFFGAFHDRLKMISSNFFLAKYSVLLPVILIAVVIFVFYIKNSKTRFRRLFAYLNLLFFVLLLLDIPVLLQQAEKKISTITLQPCADCTKPDVYLIIADEYADSASLATVFQFNNGTFQAALRKRGFFIANSVSNYNFTPFAMASLLSMNYLNGLEGRNSSYEDRLQCAAIINQNEVWNFFTVNGYEIENNSIYKINNIASAAPQANFKIGTEFIASHTLLSRLKRDLGYHLVSTLKIQSIVDEYLFYLDKINRQLLKKHSSGVKEKSGKSKFVYTHIHMPHYPYYYKSNGAPNPVVAKQGSEFDKQAYLDYLQYSNTVYIKLVDEILLNSNRPPIILFMGDHGFREFVNPTPAEKKTYFMNFNAVYLPSSDYSRFYNGISGVNQFRVVLNTAFGQNLPMLKDSTSFLEE